MARPISKGARFGLRALGLTRLARLRCLGATYTALLVTPVRILCQAGPMLRISAPARSSASARTGSATWRSSFRTPSRTSRSAFASALCRSASPWTAVVATPTGLRGPAKPGTCRGRRASAPGSARRSDRVELRKGRNRVPNAGPGLRRGLRTLRRTVPRRAAVRGRACAGRRREPLRLLLDAVGFEDDAGAEPDVGEPFHQRRHVADLDFAGTPEGDHGEHGE